MPSGTPPPDPALPNSSHHCWAWLFAALVFLALLPTASRADDGVAFFEKKVRPVLVEHCYSCHSAGAKKTKGGLQLDTPDGLRKGGTPARP